MLVGDILRKKAARVATVRMNETVAIAAQLMRSSNISALVVKDVVRTEGNTAVGMFTERDVVRAIAEHGAAGVSMKVSQLISVQQLVSCSSTDTLEHARHLMNVNHIRHLPVIDNYSLIGQYNAVLFGISGDGEESHTRFKEKHDLPFPLIADPGRSVHRLYQVTGLLPFITPRITYVIDKEGVIRAAIRHDIRVTEHVPDVVEALKKLEPAAEAS